jgi:hypothetical protein
MPKRARPTPEAVLRSVKAEAMRRVKEGKAPAIYPELCPCNIRGCAHTDAERISMLRDVIARPDMAGHVKDLLDDPTYGTAYRRFIAQGQGA